MSFYLPPTHDSILTEDPDVLICGECCTRLDPTDVDVQVRANGFFDGRCSICFFDTFIPAPGGMPALMR